ncbi:MAG: nucleotidyltransferase family protein [Mesorhizobium sp.]|nr:nucleotidyltransferase family protein [Mesorhizobium sp.]MCO5164496.1 nucleotidyltransferase family protein [Mesorhizobium sp.]
MRPSEALAKHRDEVLAIIARYPVSNPRVCGSVARGEDVEGSDIDILVHPSESLTYFDLGRLALELETVLGCKVDLGEDNVVRPYAAVRIFNDARTI